MERMPPLYCCVIQYLQDMIMSKSKWFLQSDVFVAFTIALCIIISIAIHNFLVLISFHACYACYSCSKTNSASAFLLACRSNKQKQNEYEREHQEEQQNYISQKYVMWTFVLFLPLLSLLVMVLRPGWPLNRIIYDIVYDIQSWLTSLNFVWS